MHPLERLLVHSRTIATFITGWWLAPPAPVFVGVIAKVLGASDSTVRSAVDIAASLVVLALLAASVVGAATIEDWLREVKLPLAALVAIPFGAIMLMATAAQYARGSHMLADVKLPASTHYDLMLAAWAILIAYQMKPFWDHAKEAWRKDRLRMLWRGEPYAERIDHSLEQAAAKLQEARAWRARLASAPLPTPIQAELDIWLEDPQNRLAFRTTRPKPKPLTVLVCWIALAVVAILLLRLGR